MKPKRSRIYLILAILVIAAVVSQLIPLDRTNPPVTADLDAPQQVKTVLHRSCYDCHSNETVWPWYSRIAPASWLVVGDVDDGREHLNFSHWGNYPAGKQAKLRDKIHHEVREGDMPPFRYTLIHTKTRLNRQDKQIIYAWTGPAKGGEDHGD